MLGAYLPLVCLLIGLSALFSGAETALFTLSRVQLKILKEKGGRTGRAISSLLREPRKVLNTLLLCNLFVNTVLSAILSEVFMKLFGAAGLGYAVVVSTVLLLLFGEITPKVISLSRYMAVAKIAVYPVTVCCWLTMPFRVVLRVVSNGLLRLMGLPLEKASRLTRDTYFAALTTSRSQGGLKVREADIIHGICAYRGMTAAEVRIPRTSMLAVEEGATIREALRISVKDALPWLAIYRGNQDHVVAVLDTMALAREWRSVSRDAVLKNLMEAGCSYIREPLFVPGTESLESIVREMGEKAMNFAVVLDEYGGTDGVIMRAMALDAMLGGLIGIRNYNVHIRPNGDCIVPATMRLEDVNWECSMNFPTDHDLTLSGFIQRQLGEIPEVGRTFEYAGYEITILKRSGVTLQTIRLRPVREAAR